MARTSRSMRHALSRRWTADVGPVQVVLQPIIDVSDGAVVGAEALARFPSARTSVEEVFADAYRTGRGEALEARCIRAALEARAKLPDGAFLAINVSPDALGHPDIIEALDDAVLRGIVIEVTEQAASRPASARDAITSLRERGARIAVDDATTGYAGLTRLAALRPDIVKLDRTLVTGVGTSIEGSAVVDALVSLTRRLGGQVLGEGVETLDDLAALAELDVDYAQGTVIGPPAADLPGVATEAVAACRAARRRLLLPGSSEAPTSNLHRLTAALGGSMARDELAEILRAAASSLTVDVIGLSVLDGDTHLREITATGTKIDDTSYAIVDYPATASALSTGAIVEAHVDDPLADPAERAWLVRQGFASLLVVPLIARSSPLGILEFTERSRRRWRAHDIAQARTLAEHLAHVLTRLDPG